MQELTHYLNGEHVAGTSGRFADVMNPATPVAKDVADASAGAPSGTNALPQRIRAGLQVAGSAGRILRSVLHSGR